jgi:predicted ATPase
LVTSRERLALQAEHLHELTGLDYPPSPATSLGAKALRDWMSYAAVQLFLQRVRQTQPRFAPGDEGIAAILRICRISEGIPLAVELAAAMMREQSCVALATALERSQARLAAPLRDLPERHRTITAVFDQSWQLLARDEQRVLQAITVFRGGFQRAAAELVADATPPLLSALVDKSLLRHSANGRYEVHELIRQYAYEKLAATGNLSGLQERHCRYFLSMVETAEPELTGAQNPTWLEQLDAEHDNLRAALAWSLQAEDAELAMRLAGALYWYWHLRDDAREGYDWSIAALRRSSAEQRTWARAKALKGAGTLAWNLGDLATGHALLEESITIWREVGDKGGLAHALLALGWVLGEQGNLAASYASATEGVALFRELGDQWALAFALVSQGRRMMQLGDCSTGKGIIEESIALHRTLGSKWGLALALKHFGRLACVQGDYAAAFTHYQEALTLQHDVGHHWHIARTLVNLGEVIILLGQPKQAVRLLGAVEAQFNWLGTLMLRDERRDFDRSIAAARSQLGATAFAEAWAEGQRMTLEQAVDYARATAPT